MKCLSPIYCYDPINNFSYSKDCGYCYYCRIKYTSNFSLTKKSDSEYIKKYYKKDI